MTQHRLSEFIARLVRREDLNRDEAEQLLESLLDADATDAQIAAALVALAAEFSVTRSENAARRLFLGSITYLPLIWTAMVLDH